MEVETSTPGASKPRKGSHPSSGGATSASAQKRRKVNHACLYCRRSHMHCDEARPCARCVKRDIGHLCHDEVKPAQPKPTGNANGSSSGNSTTSKGDGPQSSTPFPDPGPQINPFPAPVPSMMMESNEAFRNGTFPFTANVNPNPWPLLPQPQFIFQQQDGASAGAGREFAVLSDFLQSLDEPSSFFGQQGVPNPASIIAQQQLQQQQAIAANNANNNGMYPIDPSLTQLSPSTSMSQDHPSIAPQTASSLTSSLPSEVMHLQNLPQLTTPDANGFPQLSQMNHTGSSQQMQRGSQSADQQPQHELEHVDPIPPRTKTERFLLTAADQETGTRDERLAAVIHAKYEAGLLKPYNYVKGYARLSRWMERNCSAESRQQILQPISVLRPKFRAIAQGLTDIDLVFIEEAFERMLLDYDRVFSAMGIPACLWRRTGEIYKGNKEFADLVGIDVGRLREGRLCIYELMSEESSVNYWEKYGHVAFDPGQKAVLTSCVLRFKPALPTLNMASSGPGGTPSSKLSRRQQKERERQEEEDEDEEEVFINCCFSFTIRRDTWGIPSMIVGNFIKC